MGRADVRGLPHDADRIQRPGGPDRRRVDPVRFHDVLREARRIRQATYEVEAKFLRFAERVLGANPGDQAKAKLRDQLKTYTESYSALVARSKPVLPSATAGWMPSGFS